ncbi:MAG: polysaccharide deacetylase family protein [Alphaproteobacteria bacterium]|nr:polysaccharide deacetylase family protein [Alphaproteobacteria bacterium]
MGRVHLSFDNGPHPEVTPRVLDALRRRGLSATFFVLGRNLDTPWGMELARRIRDEGHRLGNHSYSHAVPLGDDPRPDAVAQELERTQDLLDRVASGPLWFRPFGGGGVLGPHLLSEDSLRWLMARQATCVLWNAVPEDWLDAEGWAARALDQLDAQGHSVLVLHDVLPEAMAHLDAFLGAMLDRGHRVTDALPADCLPVVQGQARPGLEGCVRWRGPDMLEAVLSPR